VSSAPPPGGGLAVPFLVDPEHEDVAPHVAEKRFFWLDLQGPSERQFQKLAQLFDLHPLTVEDAR
jgi:Mg2+ and Co2+ transporter CorA